MELRVYSARSRGDGAGALQTLDRRHRGRDAVDARLTLRTQARRAERRSTERQQARRDPRALLGGERLREAKVLGKASTVADAGVELDGRGEVPAGRMRIMLGARN